MAVLIEVCVDSVESAIAAVRGGADRLELCGNLALGGGTTPSLGLLKAVSKAVPGVPIMVMIRPRTGDFIYTALEIDVMVEDIRLFKDADAQGVVFGVLTAEGDVDLETTNALAQVAMPLQVCFHRAIDMTRNPIQAYEDLGKLVGITRVLTSGHGKTAVSPPSLETLEAFLRRRAKAGSTWPVILPGSGINPNTIDTLLRALLPHGMEEIHLSGGGWIESEMKYRPEGMGMGVGAGEWGIWRTREEVVREVRRIADCM